MGESGPPSKKMAIFCPIRPNNANFGLKTVFFLARVVNCRPLRQQSMRCTVWDPEKRCFQANPQQKKSPFYGQNGLNIPIFGQKQFCLGSGGQFKAPPPYFAGV